MSSPTSWTLTLVDFNPQAAVDAACKDLAVIALHRDVVAHKETDYPGPSFRLSKIHLET